MKSTILKMICAAAFLLSLPAFGQKVILSWNPSTPPKCGPVTAYNLYRSLTAGGEVISDPSGTPAGSKIGATSGTVLTYTDSTVSYGTTYFYKITGWAGCNTGNQESAFSNEFAAVIPAQIILIQPPQQLPPQVVIP